MITLTKLRKLVKECSSLVEKSKSNLDSLEASQSHTKDNFVLQQMILRSSIMDFELAIARLNVMIKDASKKQILDAVDLETQDNEN